ncbi:type VII secretion protein EccE [Nocardia beijingensis]
MNMHIPTACGRLPHHGGECRMEMNWMNNETMPPENSESTSRTPAPGAVRRDIFTRMPMAVVLPSAGAGAAAATAVVALGGPVRTAVAVGIGIALIGGARVRRTNIWKILGMRFALQWRNRRIGANAPRTEPFDVDIPGSGGAQCGMRWDGRHLITMLRLGPTSVRPTMLAATRIRAGSAICLADVASCLAQFDIRLAAVDVVTLGVRARGPHSVVRYYEKLLGPLPAAAEQSVRLVLRFDPLDNVGAIDNRGSGQDGVVRTALVATRRVAGRLSTRGIRVSLMTAAELAAAESAALHETDPALWSEDWSALHSGGIELAGYAIQPHRLDPAALASVWAVSGRSMLTRLRLTPAGDSEGPARRGNAVALTALVRQDLAGVGRHEAQNTPADLGHLLLSGRQRRVLLDDGDLDPSVALHAIPPALAQFSVSVSGCGQVIGATDDGLGVAVPLFGPTVRRVEIVGSLRLTQLMVLRAIAVGAQVIVHSSRPQEWAGLAEAVAAPAALSVPTPENASRHAAAATMIVYDGVASAGRVLEATAVHVRSTGECTTSLIGADVALIESAAHPGRVLIRCSGEELTVRVVSISEEAGFLGEAAPSSEVEPEHEPELQSA